MPTKLSRYCLGIMEAAWLAAVVLIPIFFDVYSTRIFEPDKITILRSLALLILAAWAIKLVDEGGIKWKAEKNDQSLFRYLLSYPMVAPVLGLVIVYTISTIFSVTPSISFFGSYQRLQGTYTTFSYLIIFAGVVGNLRKKEQVNRLLTTVIFASVPIALYGWLQRLNIDPVPWGGNVSIRIAANMGNSIFVAAYLIMVFPLTVGRIIEVFRAILIEGETQNSGMNLVKRIIRGSIYVCTAGLQLIAIYMSGSRGPLLGLLAGGYFLLLLLSVFWHKRWLTMIIIGLAVVGVAFLAVFNMNNGPLEALRKSPAIGRFGNLLNAESNSALVRQYIWQGAVKLTGVHAPLVFPDGGTDKLNFLRPLIGYGPESMYVAYNQFYQPELGQVEKRNASPDRSHNETWDSIVITGVSGLLVYLIVFGAVFYYGFKWLKLINIRRDKIFFLVCLIGGGIVGTVVMILLKGVEYLGVGLPFGIVIGLVLYLTVYALFLPKELAQGATVNPYSLLIIVLYAAIVGHFVEINFGIAIVATRTLFWIYAGLILVMGFILPKIEQVTPSAIPAENGGEMKINPPNRRKERSFSKSARRADRTKRPVIGDQPDWFRNGMIGAMMIGIILATLGFDYLTNPDHTKSVGAIILNSFTQLSNKENVFSLGVLLLIVITWLMGVLLYAAELEGTQDFRSWFKTLGLMAVVAFVIGLIFWFAHSASLAAIANFVPKTQNDVLAQVNSIGALLTKFYLYIFLLIALLAYLLPDEWPSRGLAPAYISAVGAPVALILVFIFSNASNLKVIQADITFKMAEPFANGGQWQVATYLYKQALKLAPKEDHYYLFLGRSYLEQAKVTEKVADQDTLVQNAEDDLKVAQSINPLNTDHTANLARLYTWWAGKATTATIKNERANQASTFYSTAVRLSPNNSTLWDEWAVLYMQLLDQPDQALQRLDHAMSLDTKYNYTQGLFGQYYQGLANGTKDPTAEKQYLQTAADYYRHAADVSKYNDTNSKASYLVALSNVYIQIANLDPNNIDSSQYQNAIDVLLEATNSRISNSDLWKVQEALGKLYLKVGDKANAQYYATQALANAPSSAQDRIQQLITQTLSLP